MERTPAKGRITRQQSETHEFSISSRQRRNIKGKFVHQNNKKTKINLRKNISSIAQSRQLRKKEQEIMKQQIEDERRRKIMEEQKKRDQMNLEGSPAKKSDQSKSPNANYLISVSPQTSIALMNQKDAQGTQKRSESEKLVPINDKKMKEDQFRVKEEPANMKKFQESMGQQEKMKMGNFEDSVNVQNFDSMEINRVTGLDFQIEGKQSQPEEPVKAEVPKKSQFTKRTPLHKKKSKIVEKPEKRQAKREAIEDFTIDEIELKKMETNELLEYYDRQYQASLNENQPNADTHTETHNQTMNTTDMLNEEANQQSFTKDQIEVAKEHQMEREQAQEDSIEQVDTTNVIHREVHDPQVKKGFQNRETSPDDPQFNNGGSGVLGKELLTRTQTQIKKDLENSRERMEKHLMSKADSKLMGPKTPGSKLSRHQIPATRKMTPSSGQEILIPEKKKPQTPQAIGRTEPKKPSEFSKKTRHVPTPSLYSNESNQLDQKIEEKRQDDESQPEEIDYSGVPDIPMTSHLDNQDVRVSDEEDPEEVKNYDFLGYEHDSNLQTESDVAGPTEEKKDPLAKSLDSRAREMIENGKFRDDTQKESNEFQKDSQRESGLTGTGADEEKSLSDFDDQINQNKYLLSDIGDVSQKDRKSLNQPDKYPGLIFDSKSEPPSEEVEKESQGHAQEEAPETDDDIFLLNPTKSPNLRKLRKSRKKKRKPKEETKNNEFTRNPFHDTEEEEEQVFIETEPKVDISGDFQIKTMTTPNIKKKKRKRSKRSKKHSKKKPKQAKITNVFGETHPPRKAYNLLDQQNMVPQFRTLGPFENENEQLQLTANAPNLEERVKANQAPKNEIKSQARNFRHGRYEPANEDKRFENNYKEPKLENKQADQVVLGDRFTLGNNIERFNQNWNRLSKKGGKQGQREESFSPGKRVERSISAEKEELPSIIERRNKVKKLLRNSRKRLKREIDETNSRRSHRSKSLRRTRQRPKESFEHENRMNKYAMKGIDREKLKEEVYLKHSILRQEIPEINAQLQKDLENYQVFEVKKTLHKAKIKKKGRRDRKDRLRKLEREIADLTKNVEQQVEDNEVFKAKVHQRYEDDED